MANGPVNTRERLLDVAGKLFADKGFAEATVAEICRGAEANIAAVNYHFGSKENLYQEAWRHAHGKALRLSPPDGGVAASAPAADRLRGRIRGILQRAMAAEGVEFRIMGQEMAKPTGLLAKIVEEAIRPMRQATERIVIELLGGAKEPGEAAGGAIDPQVLRLCEISIIAPCMMIVRRRHFHGRGAKGGNGNGGMGPEFTPDMLEGMVEHFTSFALAGVAAVKERMKAGSDVSDLKSEIGSEAAAGDL